MHPLFEKADGLTENIIGAAIEVHRNKGPGLVESIYEWCLLRELEIRKLTTENQRFVRQDRVTRRGATRSQQDEKARNQTIRLHSIYSCRSRLGRLGNGTLERLTGDRCKALFSAEPVR